MNPILGPELHGTRPGQWIPSEVDLLYLSSNKYANIWFPAKIKSSIMSQPIPLNLKGCKPIHKHEETAIDVFY